MYEFKRPAPTDFWGLYKICVKDMGINPSEVWNLDLIEITYLLDSGNKQEMDTSIMLNFERARNGASKKWLQSHSQ